MPRHVRLHQFNATPRSPPPVQRPRHATINVTTPHLPRAVHTNDYVIYFGKWAPECLGKHRFRDLSTDLL
ncbi:hypothetical protein Aduo_002208 [Ancylostoma duodenale]